MSTPYIFTIFVYDFFLLIDQFVDIVSSKISWSLRELVIQFLRSFLRSLEQGPEITADRAQPPTEDYFELP